MTSSQDRADRSLRYYRAKLPEEPDVYPHFLAEIDAAASPGAVVLDVGCGEEFILQHLRGRVSRVIGLDVASRAHPYDEMLVGDIQDTLALEPGSVNAVVGKFVFEHLAQPARAVREIQRILTPGGRAIVLTPDIRYPPYGVNFILSRALPQSTRMKLVAAATGRPNPDIFPVHYRANTPRRLKALFAEAGLTMRRLETFSDFPVIAGWRTLGWLGTQYEVGLNRLGLRGPRGFILGVFERGDGIAAAL